MRRLMIIAVFVAAGCKSARDDCMKAKAALGPASNVVFSKMTSKEAPALPWRIEFYGVEVRVPEGDYDVLPSVANDGKNVSLVLSNDHRKILMLHEPPLDKLDTGKTAHDLALLGYSHTPSDVTCDPSNLARDGELMEALVLKAISGGMTNLKVYRDTFDLEEIVYDGKTSTGWEKVEAQVSKSDRSQFFTFLSKGAVEPIRNESMLRNCGADCTTDGPQWLAPLAAALKTPTDEASWATAWEAMAKTEPSGKTKAAFARLLPVSP